jgi:hypothetical protein
MRGRSSGKTGPPVPGLTRVGGGAINISLSRLDTFWRIPCTRNPPGRKCHAGHPPPRSHPVAAPPSAVHT